MGRSGQAQRSPLSLKIRDHPTSKRRLWHLKAAPGKFEVKRLGALEHSNDGMVVSSGDYSASNFAGSASSLFFCFLIPCVFCMIFFLPSRDMAIMSLRRCRPMVHQTIDFQRKFRERLCRLVHFPELFTVASHEHRDFTGGLGKMQQGSVHFLL